MFRFRLRTLLIVVAVLAVPMAWVESSLRWIAEREKAVPLIVRQEWEYLADQSKRGVARPRSPGLLWMFGEEGLPELYRFDELSDDEREHWERAKRLFPEAKVITIYNSRKPAPNAPATQD